MTLPMEPPQTVALLDARYQLHERVGEGGMATVYRAEDTFLGRTVAIKLLRNEAEVLSSPVRAHREVSALARLNHPSLVTLLEANLAPGECRYLVMEYIDGPNLARLLRDGPLSTAQVAHLARELGSGLAVVHAAGLVHRDIKPSNILLAPAPRPDTLFRVKLADFGLAQLADATSVTTPGMVTGTAAYLAPEQVRGEASSAASDIYALGLVLLEALTGERAFGHASGIGAVMARLLEPPAIPSDVDLGWADLVRRMTLSDPVVRPTALEVLDTVSTLPASAARPASTAVLPQSVVPADTAPMRRRPLAPTHARPAHRRRRRPGAWIGAGAAASFLAVALVCIPGIVAGSTGTAPATRLVVDRLAEEMAQDPAVSPATVELASDTSSSNEVVDPGSVTQTDTHPPTAERGSKSEDDEPKAEPEVEPKPKKNAAVDGPAQREPADGKPADAAKERGNRDR